MPSTNPPTRPIGFHIHWGVAFIAATGILFFRLLPRLQHPGLWAEDGTDFLADSLQFHSASLLRPYAGYFHTIPRLYALALTKLIPVRYFSQGTAISCALTYAFVASLIARDGYAHLIPSARLRVALCCVLCLAPGQVEVLGNLTNLHSLLAFGFWILALRKPREDLSAWEGAYCVLAIMSAGETAVLLPVWAYRVFRFPKPFPRRELALIIFGLCFALINTLLSRHFDNGQPFIWAWIPPAFRSLIVTGCVYWEWLGPPTAHYLATHTNSFFYSLWAITLIVACSIAIARRGDASVALELAVALAVVLAMPVLTWIVRPGSADFFSHRILDPELAQERYAFQIWMPFTVVWAITCAQLARAYNKGSALPAFFLANVAISAVAFTPVVPKLDGDWELRAQEFEAAVSATPPRPIAIPIAPRQYNFVLHYPRQSP